VLRSPEREKLSSYFIEFSIKKISEALMIKTDGRMDPKDVDFIARVYAYAYSGIILKWISEGMPDDGIELAEKIDTVVSASMNPVIEALMKKSAENKKPETL
jgi:hypothetical protein